MLRRALLIAAISAAAPAAAADAVDFSDTYFFGDSLTDSGTFAVFLPPGLGKFTTNPGPVWSENFAAALGGDGRPSVAGGHNFAQGGARVAETPGVPAADTLTANVLPIRDQVSLYLGLAGRADPNAIYAVWGGANDVFQAIDPNTAESANPLPYLATTAAQLTGEIGRLRAAGARYLLVPNVPDIAVSPFGASLGSNAAAASALVGAYNQALYADLAAAGLRVIPLDIFTLVNEVVASPATYGLANVSDPACGATRVYLCGAADLVVPGADATYLFADGVHPTTAGHRLVSDYALGVVHAPTQISLLAESPLDTRAALARTIHDQATVAVPSPDARTRLWGSAGGGRLKYESSGDEPGAHGKVVDFALGIDHRFTPQLTLGAAFAASRIKPDFTAGASGRYQQDERALALYAAVRSGRWHMSAVAAVGRLEFDTQRLVALGPVIRTMDGRTAGRNRSLGLVAGFDSSTRSFKHGPVVGLHAQRVDVDGFAEREQGLVTSTAMAFGDQKRESRVGSLGYQVSYAGATFSPYARLSFAHEFKKSERQVNASLLTVPDSSFELPALTPDRNYATGVVGLGIRLSAGVTANIALSERLGKDRVRAYGAQAVLTVEF